MQAGIMAQKPQMPPPERPRLSLAEEQRLAFDEDRLRGTFRSVQGVKPGLLGHLFRN